MGKSKKRKYYEEILGDAIDGDRVLNPKYEEKPNNKRVSKDLQATVANMKKLAIYLGYPTFEEATEQVQQIITEVKNNIEELEDKIMDWKASRAEKLNLSLNDYSLENIISTVTSILSGEKIHLQVGNVFYTLNRSNIDRILKLIHEMLSSDFRPLSSDCLSSSTSFNISAGTSYPKATALSQCSMAALASPFSR